MKSRLFLLVLSLLLLLVSPASAATSGKLSFTNQTGSSIEYYQTGSQVFIRLEDSDLNLDSQAVDSATVIITSNTENYTTPASFTTPIPDPANSGDGNLLDVRVSDLTATEEWTVQCLTVANTWYGDPINDQVDVYAFSVTGSASGAKLNYQYIYGYDQGYTSSSGDIGFRLETGSAFFAPGDTFTFSTSAAVPRGETVALTETTSSSGIFTGSISINNSDLPVQGNNILEAQRGDTLAVYYNDASNDWGKPLRVSDTAIYGATVVTGGERLADFLWSKENSPYLVTGDVIVQEGVTLTIEPGVTVLFLTNSDDQGIGRSPYDSELIIHGQLAAVGITNEPIIFTSSARTPFKGDWGGLYFESPCCETVTTLLQHIDLQYSSYGIRTENFRHMTITSSVISNNGGDGIFVNYIGADDGSVTVNNCTLTHNEGNGISIYSNYSTSTIAGNDIADNRDSGIYYFYSSGKLTISGNNFSGNGSAICAQYFRGAGDAIIENNTLTNNNSGICLYNLNDTYYSDIHFLITGNTIRESNNRGVAVEGKVTADISNNEINDNGYGLQIDYSDINGDGSSIVTGNRITNNRYTGIGLSGYARPDISYNDINDNATETGYYSNYYTIANYTPFEISARHNWWGETDTQEIINGENPRNLSFISDYFDNPTQGMVNYSAWATASMDDADGDGLLDELEEAGCTEPLNPDTDSDGLPDGVEDANHNGMVDNAETNPCNADSDGDSYQDNIDPFPANPAEWTDSDGDGIGDNADLCPLDAGNDPDGDTICALADNCPETSNPDQADCDNDETGDGCDTDSPCSEDFDNDGVFGVTDNCVSTPNPDQADCDNDGTGDGCDTDSPCSEDFDNDGVFGVTDNCVSTHNPDQADCDNDGTGDGCDPASPCSEDRDYDGILDNRDNCLDAGSPALPQDALDDFETDTARMPWLTNGDSSWLISGDNPLFGEFSMSSPALADGESATLELVKDCDTGVVGFTHRVDTEQDYDFLSFYIDDELQDAWSGSTGYTSAAATYTPATYPVSSGYHVFKWVFSKDESLAGGRDRVSIDNVFFGAGSFPWPDFDHDTISDPFDNCPEIANLPQSDSDHDKTGDICETDNQGAFESFESGDFSQFPWVLGGDASWFVPPNYWYGVAFEGNYCARTPWLSDNGQARLSLKVLTKAGQMSFRYWIDSEADHDFLAFYIDNVLQQRWSGSADYTTSSGLAYTVQVSAGYHTFKWVYEKDGSGAGGLDAAWIDNINLPYAPVVDIPGYNPDQTDADTDGLGDVCDPCPLDGDNDFDDDTVCGNLDLCPGSMPGETVDENGCSVSQLDLDGDGYQGPAGDNSDCDDNDPLEFPGQLWYKDLNGDGISDGTINNTSCTRPDGYYALVELTASSGDMDDDGDGMDDGWELSNGLDTTIDDAFADLDSDGFCNLRELLSMSNPDDELDLPGLIADKDADNDVDGNDLALFNTESGRTDCSEQNACAFDLNTDGTVDSIDLNLLTEDFGRSGTTQAF
ncbi:MAG: right-handed parallel beta-helix repeat-containing protein [Deltaproteobacteria bacterium]|nr:right-handed parallel beta-helix repeat-containing protein [Deltaproteobacteria bacterium]